MINSQSLIVETRVHSQVQGLHRRLRVGACRQRARRRSLGPADHRARPVVARVEPRPHRHRLRALSTWLNAAVVVVPLVNGVELFS